VPSFAGTQGKKPAAAVTSATAVPVAKSETAGLLWDASNSRMLAAIGTLATAALQATSPILRPQKCSFSLKKIKFRMKNLEISTFDSLIIKPDSHFLGENLCRV
jgi:hypothetical protein